MMAALYRRSCCPPHKGIHIAYRLNCGAGNMSALHLRLKIALFMQLKGCECGFGQDHAQ